MPFGMKTAPATFQRMMSKIVLRGLEFADTYIDDVEVDTYGLLTKFVRSRWLDIGQVIFLRVYGPRRSRGP